MATSLTLKTGPLTATISTNNDASAQEIMLRFAATEAAAFQVYTNGANRLEINSSGDAAFTGIISTPAQSATSVISITNTDLGAGTGGQLFIGRNTNASTPAPGALVLGKVNAAGNCYIWCDDSGNIRTQLNATVTSSNRNSGTVVGAQTSSLDSKDVIEGVSSIDDVLTAVQRGAEAVRRFTYKSGAFGGEEFEGVVVDYAPRYGMDRDAEHGAGKSLNVISIVGDLLRAVAWLVGREHERIAKEETIENEQDVT